MPLTLTLTMATERLNGGGGHSMECTTHEGIGGYVDAEKVTRRPIRKSAAARRMRYSWLWRRL